MRNRFHRFFLCGLPCCTSILPVRRVTNWKLTVTNQVLSSDFQVTLMAPHVGTDHLTQIQYTYLMFMQINFSYLLSEQSNYSFLTYYSLLFSHFSRGACY